MQEIFTMILIGLGFVGLLLVHGLYYVFTEMSPLRWLPYVIAPVLVILGLSALVKNRSR